MLFYKGLEEIIFNRYQLFRCDELIILSGYVGPIPVKRLGKLPLKIKVIYGMYGSDGIQSKLHEALLEEHQKINNVEIFYSTAPIHSKIYIWKNKGEVIHALIGSANFSTNGLTTPFKEVLAETTSDTFSHLDDYLKLVLEKCIKCNDAVINKSKYKFQVDKVSEEQVIYNKDVCSMPLYIMENNEKTVPKSSGINWGMAKLNGSHVNINDAYIPISIEHIEHYPELFPKKQESPFNVSNIIKPGHRHNDNIEIIWDDGTIMTGLLEGSIPKLVNEKKVNYPKQISTTPSKADLGKYIRKRLEVKEGQAIKIEDLKSYGRDSIDVSLQGEGIYYFNFSPKI